MFDDLTALFDFDFSAWVSSIVDYFTVTNTVDGNDILSMADPPWSAFIPWPQLFSFVFLVVFLILIFKFLRSVLCKML